MGRATKTYISEIDKFLNDYNEKHPKTASQQVEIDKYARIDKLRDRAIDQPEPEEDIWDF